MRCPNAREVMPVLCHSLHFVRLLGFIYMAPRKKWILSFCVVFIFKNKINSMKSKERAFPPAHFDTSFVTIASILMMPVLCHSLHFVRLLGFIHRVPRKKWILSFCDVFILIYYNTWVIDTKT